MFAIAHAYLMERIFPERTPMHYLGCVWPDMLFNGPLKHEQTHRDCLALLADAHDHAPALVPFVRAAITHGEEPHGFDWYSDRAYDPGAPKGYAFERARPFVAEVVAATKVSPDIGLWKAHNFVEMSFEIALGHAYPHLGPMVAAACTDKELVRAVADLAAAHFHVSAEELARNIIDFPATVALDQPTSLTLAQAYMHQLDLKHGVTDPDVPAMAGIIDRVWESIAPDREAFLEYCVREVAAMMTGIVA
jgi:hypothetical protein